MSKSELKDLDLEQVSGGKTIPNQVSFNDEYFNILATISTGMDQSIKSKYELTNTSIIGINHNEFKTILSDNAQKIIDLSREISKIFKHKTNKIYFNNH